MQHLHMIARQAVGCFINHDPDPQRGGCRVGEICDLSLPSRTLRNQDAFCFQESECALHRLAVHSEFQGKFLPSRDFLDPSPTHQFLLQVRCDLLDFAHEMEVGHRMQSCPKTSQVSMRNIIRSDENARSRFCSAHLGLA